MSRLAPFAIVRIGRAAPVLGIGLLLAACAAQGGPPASSSASPTDAPVAPSPTPAASVAQSPKATGRTLEAVRVPSAVTEGGGYHPVIDPAAFSTIIDNPYLPLTPGTTWRYEGDGEQIEVTVTGSTRQVMGVSTAVVRDRVREDGKLTEDTEDWYAQDRAGNVWYFGEDTSECKDGVVTSRHGAWEAGVDGAQPGVAMLADPRVGDLYRQEFYAGEAEDQARVIKLDGHVEGPAGTFDDVLVTEDFTPLEPDLLEEKSYARGVGVIQEQTVKGGSGVVRLLEVVRSAPPLAEPAAFDPCHE